MSRLSIEIEPEQHRQIKTLATFEGKSIKDFILSRTLNLDKSSKNTDTTDENLPDSSGRDQVLEALKTPREDYVVFETIDELEDALGI